jgi:hypothetical protein
MKKDERTTRGSDDRTFVVSPASGTWLSIKRFARSMGPANALILVVGWLLSPLSFWNDAFVNIPLACAIAYPLHRFGGLGLRSTTAAAYLLTNVLGLVLIYLALRKKRQLVWRIPAIRTILTALAFSVLAAVVAKQAFELMAWLGRLF